MVARYEIWDHWTMVGEVQAADADTAIAQFKRVSGLAHVKLFAYRDGLAFQD